MKEKYDVIEKIIPLFQLPSKYNDIGDLLVEHSNLPGPRGNLTLADKFADEFKEPIQKELLDLLIQWINISEVEAPTNHPREYLPFCGILALGSNCFYGDEKTKSIIMDQFKVCMNSKRWRTREGAAMGLQRIAEKDFEFIKKYISDIFQGSTLLEKRAFIAALAHPPILNNKEVTLFSIKISKDILDEVITMPKDIRKSEEFGVLSKGLQYALSVFVSYLPKEGFDFIKEYAQIKDSDIIKILKSNLNKSRLTKKFPQIVEEVSNLLK